jgi:uncharacterized protein YjaZ
MNIQHHILDASGVLAPFRAKLEDVVSRTIGVIDNLLPIASLDVCVSHHPAGSNPKLGIGGAAFDAIQLHIFLDANNNDLASAIEQELPAVLAHEMHHCARLQVHPDAETLAEKLIIEGLACKFETEITGERLPSFIPPALMEQCGSHWQAAQELLDNNEFCLQSWFHGQVPDKMPNYLGYALGLSLTEKYLSFVDQTAAQAYAVPTNEVISMLRDTETGLANW